MKIHRFFLNTGFLEGEMSITDNELIHQMRDVLKLHDGEKCVLFNAAEQEAHAHILQCDINGVTLSVEKIIQKSEQKTKITLYCAILKRENFELVVQKATELGVHEIVPIITQRTVKTGLKHERLEKIATEATEQSGHTYIPVIQKPILFSDALHKAQDHTRVVVLHTEISQGDNSFSNTESIASIGVFVGPEGGFTQEEIQQAKEYRYSIHTFPHMVLRAETAAIIGVFWAHNLFMTNNMD